LGDAIVVRGLNKQFRHRNVNAPTTLQEACVGRGRQRRGPGGVYWALNNIDLCVPEGKMVGIIGANGAGKSTLLRLICGIGRPDSGTITVNGRLTALLDMGAGFHPELTGRENVFTSGIVSGLTRQEVRQRFDSIVDFSELHEFIDDPLRTYSAGMAIRLAFAVTVAVRMNADILLIDEVLAVGDAAFQKKCFALMEEFREKGMTILLASHDGATLRKMADEVVWLRAGQVAAQGSPDSVFKQYENGIAAEPTPIPIPTPIRQKTFSFGRRARRA
jgi:lipopolysaccharide transport system ATP-binding protein